MPYFPFIYRSSRSRSRHFVLCAAWLACCTAIADPPRFKHSAEAVRPYYSEPPLPPPPYTVQETPPKSPAVFNPDPGKWDTPAAAPAKPDQANANTTGASTAPAAATPPQAPPSSLDTIAPDYSLLLPEAPPLAQPSSPTFTGLIGETLDPRLSLPRRGVKGYGPVKQEWSYPKYPLGREGLGLFPYSKGAPNRWLLNFPHWTRYMDPSVESAYQYDTPLLWHPYRQSTLKGDVPIIGQDIFLDLTAKNFSLFEGRRLPVGSGISAASPNSSEFFGRGDQLFISSDNSFSFDFFKGETAFKPVDWAIRVTAVENVNWIWVGENNLINPNPLGSDQPTPQSPPNPRGLQAIPRGSKSVNPQSGDPGVFNSTVDPGDAFNYIAPHLKPTGNARTLVPVNPLTNQPVKGKAGSRSQSSGGEYTYRQKDFFSFQEAFAELHVADISNNYDFISTRTGIQPFVSDFRGFIFDDTNLGARLFGNAQNNKIQYNLMMFNMREKDTYSGLNEIDSRHQQVLIANVFKQDFFAHGYTAEFSFHANWDDGGVHYDKNGFLTRPTPLGTVRLNSKGQLMGHEVDSYYFGWTGDGHLGRFNLTHAFYEVVGRDNFNQLAGRSVSINAQMAALELSYDANWIRFRLSGFYASGSANPKSHNATGFDSILDNPAFVGGPFSWYVHEAPNLAGTAVNLKQNDSLVPDLRSSKTEDQSNFVNPGVFIVGAGVDADLTPKIKLFSNLNYIWLAETAPVKLALMTDQASRDLGLDFSMGFKYRPLLTDNIIVSVGGGLFFPGEGYRDIYRMNTHPISGYGPQTKAGQSDSVLYNAFLSVSFTY